MKLKQFKHAPRGFSLVELIAAVIIIGILAGGAAIGISAQLKKAKINTTAGQISTFSQAIELFELDCGFLPSSLEDLIQEPSGGRRCKGYPGGGFLKKKEIGLDGWNGDYNYAKPGIHNPSGFDLWSNGPDGEEGTSDDITNWASSSDEGDV